MTKRKLDPLVQLPSFVPRRHYACRVRLDLWNTLKEKCSSLNCSQGVYLEILLEKSLTFPVSELSVTPQDLFKYSSQSEKLPLK